MKVFKILTIFFLFSTILSKANSTEIYFVDMKQILNSSKAGKQAQEYLKKKFQEQSKKFDKEQSSLKKDEADLIAKKKLISPEEYKKNLNLLREKNITFQKKRQKASNEILRKKEEARLKLYKALNPILEKYMSENNIQMIIDKKNVIISKTDNDLTQKILKILDQELKSIKLN